MPARLLWERQTGHQCLQLGHGGLLRRGLRFAGSAHAARLALIFALLDGSDQIDLEHLEAALAVWTYAEASSAWIFGDSLGDPTADDIWTLAKTRPDGISRTEVRDLFSPTRRRVRSTARSARSKTPAASSDALTLMGAADPPSSGSHESPSSRSSPTTGVAHRPSG